MVTPFAELEKAEPVVARMGSASLELWGHWLPQLPKPVFFQMTGSLVTAHRQDLHDLEAFRGRVQRKLDDPAQMESLDAAALADREPTLARRFGRALFFPNEGQLEPRELLPALAEALRHLDVTWLSETEVHGVEPGVLDTSRGIHRFDTVVDCRGLGARGRMPSLRGVRGELLRLYAPEVDLHRPVRLMHPRYPIYIAPRPDHHFIVGATQIESEDMGALTVRSALELLSAVYSLDPAFGEANVLESAVHCRPALPDNDPKVLHQEGLAEINGLYRHGYLVAPILAEIAVDLIEDRSPRFEEVVQTTATPDPASDSDGSSGETAPSKNAQAASIGGVTHD